MCSRPNAVPSCDSRAGPVDGCRAGGDGSSGWSSAALFAAALGSLVADQVQARREFDRAQTSLGVTRRQTQSVSARLTAVRRNLALLTTQVGNDSTALSQDASQLKGAQAALATDEAHVSQQASQITSLQTCLGGVEQALNALAVGSQSQAIAALHAVSSSCSAAAASSG